MSVDEVERRVAIVSGFFGRTGLSEGLEVFVG